MVVIEDARGTGKTRKLLQLAAENNGQVLVAGSIPKNSIKVKAHYYGIDHVPILDWNDLLYGEYDKTKPLYIDNAEYVFAEYLKNNFELNLEGLNVNLED